MDTYKGNQAPPAEAQADGSLLVNNPTAETHFDFGNQRIFACVDGSGALRSLHLAEGIRVVNRQEVICRVNGQRLDWAEAEVFARLFQLHGRVGAVQASLTVTCDEESDAVLQRWAFRNEGSQPVRVMVESRLRFNLKRPTYNPHSLMQTLQHWLEGAPGAFLFGARRWKIENQLGERLKTPPGEEETPMQADGLRLFAEREGGYAAFSLFTEARLEAESGQAVQEIEITPGESVTLDWLLHGSREAPDPEAVLRGAERHAERLRASLHGNDATERSLYASAQTTAESMYKRLPSGFSGLWAGPGYAYPPRIYFRDSYWTAQPLLDTHPEWLLAHILSLALGIADDGTCPSGVIDPAAVGKTKETAAPQEVAWMPAHFDSPAFFILLVSDYLEASGDLSILREKVGSCSIFEHMQACAAYLAAQDEDNDGLPEKGENPNDWADNVLRYPWVSYDLGLIYGAWQALARICTQQGDAPGGETWSARAERLRRAANEKLWLPKKKYFADYARADYIEEHLALDTLTMVRFGLADEVQSAALLQSVRDQLFSRENPHQPWKDWGVMCCYPPYRRQADLFAKSADEYRYHNGADWPYLSALAADLLREYGFPKEDWGYALTRWWRYSLVKGWLTPVEFYSPGYPPGAFLQGWSGLAALVLRSGSGD